MADADQPDIDGTGALGPQTIRCVQQLTANSPAAAVHVDGDVLTMVVGLDLSADVALVYLIAEGGRSRRWVGVRPWQPSPQAVSE